MAGAALDEVGRCNQCDITLSRLGRRRLALERDLGEQIKLLLGCGGLFEGLNWAVLAGALLKADPAPPKAGQTEISLSLSPKPVERFWPKISRIKCDTQMRAERSKWAEASWRLRWRPSFREETMAIQLSLFALSC